MKTNLKQYTLILSKNFVPLTIVNAKKSMKYLINDSGKALDPVTYAQYTFEEWLEANNNDDQTTTVRTEKLWIKIPEIIILNGGKDVNFRKSDTSTFSKRKVFERDNNQCGYCGVSVTSKTRTIDHIHPVSKGGKDEYSNVVTCCGKCNRKKGNRLLSDIGWDLLYEIGDPTKNILFNVPKSKRLKCWDNFINP